MNGSQEQSMDDAAPWEGLTQQSMTSWQLKKRTEKNLSKTSSGSQTT